MSSLYVLEQKHKLEQKNKVCPCKLQFYIVKVDTGYPHDGRADKDSYPHDGRADKDSYPHDGRADKDSYPHDRHNQYTMLCL